MNTIIENIDPRGVATITLNRPDKHHAFNSVMIAALTDCMARLKTNNAVRVVVLTAEGDNFCAGGDLGWMQAQATADRDGKIREARRLAMMLKSIHDLPKPVICRVQGNAFGGGLGLMAVADITIASRRAKFALTETRLGLIPATIGPFVIARIGSAAVRSVFITGAVITAERAEGLGLVSIVADDADLNAAVEREVATALKAAPAAMARAKALTIALTARALDADIEVAITALADCWETDEAKDGIKAFFAKTPPPWVSAI